MRINHNLAAMNTYRQLGINSNVTAKSLEKLSSGLRINRAGDDAAGLAISEKMRAQIRGLDQASKNAQNGISLIQTAEGALNETHDILQRMRELADQAANDTNVNVDRTEIQKEINALSSEINRIGNTTEFNTQKLLNGGGEKVEIDPTTVTAGGQTGDTGAFAKVTGSVAEVEGVYTLTVGALTAGSTVIVGNQTFSVVNGVADASLGEVSADGTVGARAASLAAAINANAALSDRFENATSAANVVTLTESTGKATGVALTATGVTATQTTASVKEVAGKYTINLDHAFEVAGATLTINGVALTAATGTAGANQFLVNSDREQQTKDIAAAINANTAAALGQRFEATVKGTTITLTEKAGKATGADLAAGNFVDSATAAVAGKYNIDFSSLVPANGRITIDGTDIAIVTDASDARLATGEAMLAGTTDTQQSVNLVAAINKNSTLNLKYSASVSGDKLTLTQKTGQETLDAPIVSTNTSVKDGFEASLQVGANTAQSMTVAIADMRSVALKVTGNDADNLEVTAKNGTVAAYVSTTNVTNGTTNDNVEYALDVSTHEKATAAISMINDAIETVSAQRSQLGAFQNRLEHSIKNLDTSSENLSAAESRIRDVDMAKEMMTFTAKNILQQAAQAMLAQANQQPQGVLQLLR